APLAVASKHTLFVLPETRLRLWPLGVKKMSRLPPAVGAANELRYFTNGARNAAPAPRPRRRLRREKRRVELRFRLIGGTSGTPPGMRRMKRGAPSVARPCPSRSRPCRARGIALGRG